MAEIPIDEEQSARQPCPLQIETEQLLSRALVNLDHLGQPVAACYLSQVIALMSETATSLAEAG